jgi:hypothetical protein
MIAACLSQKALTNQSFLNRKFLHFSLPGVPVKHLFYAFADFNFMMPAQGM